VTTTPRVDIVGPTGAGVPAAPAGAPADPCDPLYGPVVRWVTECVNGRRYDVLDEILRPDFWLHAPPHLSGDTVRGIAGYRRYLQGLLTAYPDLTADVVDLFGVADRVALRLDTFGTHAGPYRGLPPTGVRVRFGQTLIVRLAGGKIAEAWLELDALGVALQLGVAPPFDTKGPAAAAAWAGRLAVRSAKLARRHRHAPVPTHPRTPGPVRVGAGVAVRTTGLELERNKTTLRRWIDECVNQQAIGICDDLFTDDYLGHSPPHAEPEPLRGPRGYARFITGILTGFPDAHATIEDLFAVGDRVAVRVVMSGTHLNEYRGIPPTGRPFTISQIVLCRMVDGKIAESWQEIDAKGLMLQFGIVPSVDGGTLRLLSWFTGLPVTFATAPRRIQRRKRELADSGGVRR